MANGNPVTYQTLRQLWGTGEDIYVHLADWTLNAAAIEKKKKKKEEEEKEKEEEMTILSTCIV